MASTTIATNNTMTHEVKITMPLKNRKLDTTWMTAMKRDMSSNAFSELDGPQDLEDLWYHYTRGIFQDEFKAIGRTWPWERVLYIMSCEAKLGKLETKSLRSEEETLEMMKYVVDHKHFWTYSVRKMAECFLSETIKPRPFLKSSGKKSDKFTEKIREFQETLGVVVFCHSHTLKGFRCKVKVKGDSFLCGSHTKYFANMTEILLHKTPVCVDVCKIICSYSM